MSLWPRLMVYHDKIAHNAARIVSLCRQWNISIYGVTKGICAQKDIVRILLENGCEGVADSRIENVYRMKKEMGVTIPIMMLRTPMLNEVSEVVEYCDSSVVSEVETIRALDQECSFHGKQDYKVLLMIDLGDLREGIWPDELENIAAAFKKCRYVHCMGVGANFACFGGILPSSDKLRELGRLSQQLEGLLGYPMELCSGGATSSLSLLEDGTMPRCVNSLRIGEGIFLGTDSSGMRVIPYLHQGTMVLETEIIEIKRKPSLPQGRVMANAFGEIPAFTDRGWRLRAITAVGRQDVKIERLTPLEKGIEILGATSDHMVLDVEESERQLHVGDRLHFSVDYSAMLALTTSPYVSVHMIR